MNLIEERLKKPHYIIFSDDMKWVKKQFSSLPRVTFVDDVDRPDSVDLQLMQMCKHHIIANSTFSWWGAWLASTPHHIVVMPKKWSNSCPQAVDAFCMKGWIQA